ncbi:MAG: TRAP transporter substrate-binding protein DctP [Gammaproteobacteria bacterium]|nr:TRAP transporter substrate-binding protein DctP [Gammaproteobacteria bacterium]
MNNAGSPGPGKLFSALLLSAFILASSPLQAKKIYTLKFATLAPAGTTWVNMLQDWADEVRRESQGRLLFKIYPGGVQGDEPEVLKKIRFGQLQGGAFTGYGIGQIYSPTRVLELPFLFHNIEEIDYVRKQFMPDIEQGYRDNGYELIGWMEVGFVYFFSQQPIQSLGDLQHRRIWNWQGDPMGTAFFDASGLSPIPLSIIDVYTSLSTGLIDTVYAPPLGAIAMQWFTKTRYITDVPMANGIGSLVVSRRFYQDLPQDLQKLLKRTGEATGERLIAATRHDNIEALEILQQRGMQLVKGDEDLESGEVENIRIRAGEYLMSTGYIPKAVIDKVNHWLQEYRAGKMQAPVNVAE